MKYALIALALCACSTAKKNEAEPAPDPRLPQVQALVVTLEARATQLEDQYHWLAVDCDGFGWEGERAAARLTDPGELQAAQLEAGKYDRRPAHGCPYTWSRDMLVRGFLPYVWLHRRRDLLEAHARYGESHGWKMGSPLGDLRVVYVPAEIAAIRQTIVALGGADNPVESVWPDAYPSGLDDYEADLQVMNIWLRGEVAAGENAPDMAAREGSISKTMADRLAEHAAAEPRNMKFQAVFAKYTGDFTRAIDDVLDPTAFGTAVRCDADVERCQIAERLFTARVILRKYGMDVAGSFP